MTFSYDPSNNIGKCRLYCFDNIDGTYRTDYNFTDEDISAFLEQNSDSIWLSCADMCRALAVLAAGSAFALTIPGALELDKKQISQRYLTLADRYQARSMSTVDNVVEYVDSYAIAIDQLGVDNSEYVGDV